jgi:LPS-assembly lipoprotein
MLLSKSNGLRTALVCAAVSLALTACQVRPLYLDSAPNAAGLTTNVALNSIAVKEVESRLAQEVRNQLIFALSGGAGEPASPAYTLDLGVTSQTVNAALSQNASGNVGQPTAGRMVVSSLYVLRDASGNKVASGKRIATASFDFPLQQFASLRAQRDAENRAARELADMLKLALAADLARM